MVHQGSAAPIGSVSFDVIKAYEAEPTPTTESLWTKLLRANPLAPGLEWEVRKWRFKNMWNIIRGGWRIAIATIIGAPRYYGSVDLTAVYANGYTREFGLASLQKVTNAGVGFIVDAFTNDVELETMQYHGIGTTNTAENNGDSDLAAELTTQYSTNNTRATGTNNQPSANQYRSVATNNVDATVAIVEHGIFSSATVGAGVLLDRSVFSTINLTSGDGLQSTYTLTIDSEANA